MDGTHHSLARTRPAGLGIVAAAALTVAMLAVAVARVGLPSAAGAFTGTAYDPPKRAPEFALTDHRGDEASLADYQGRAIIVFFGFTSCPDVCPLTLQKLSRVLGTMDTDTADVKVLLVTVDPERDSPDALAGYVSRFEPWVTGLTGDTAALAAMRREYGVYAGAHPGDHGAALTHTPAVFGVDRAGKLRVLLPMEREDGVVARDIRRLMAR